MVARERGGILNLSSVAGFMLRPYMAIDYASKGFVRLFSEALYQELRYTGVTVTYAAPGWVRAPFHDRARVYSRPLFRFLPKLDPNDVAERAWRGLDPVVVWSCRAVIQAGRPGGGALAFRGAARADREAAAQRQ